MGANTFMLEYILAVNSERQHMANLSQLRRQRMLAFLEKMREQHKDDDEVLVAINEVENEINEKKYGLVWEEHSEEVEERMVDEVPIFVEDKDNSAVLQRHQLFFIIFPVIRV